MKDQKNWKEMLAEVNYRIDENIYTEESIWCTFAALGQFLYHQKLKEKDEITTERLREVEKEVEQDIGLIIAYVINKEFLVDKDIENAHTGIHVPETDKLIEPHTISDILCYLQSDPVFEIWKRTYNLTEFFDSDEYYTGDFFRPLLMNKLNKVEPLFERQRLGICAYDAQYKFNWCHDFLVRRADKICATALAFAAYAVFGTLSPDLYLYDYSIFANIYSDLFHVFDYDENEDKERMKEVKSLNDLERYYGWRRKRHPDSLIEKINVIGRLISKIRNDFVVSMLINNVQQIGDLYAVCENIIQKRLRGEIENINQQ